MLRKPKDRKIISQRVLKLHRTKTKGYLWLRSPQCSRQIQLYSLKMTQTHTPPSKSRSVKNRTITRLRLSLCRWHLKMVLYLNRLNRSTKHLASWELPRIWLPCLHLAPMASSNIQHPRIACFLLSHSFSSMTLTRATVSALLLLKTS